MSLAEEFIKELEANGGMHARQILEAHYKPYSYGDFSKDGEFGNYVYFEDRSRCLLYGGTWQAQRPELKETPKELTPAEKFIEKFYKTECPPEKDKELILSLVEEDENLEYRKLLSVLHNPDPDVVEQYENWDGDGEKGLVEFAPDDPEDVRIEYGVGKGGKAVLRIRPIPIISW